MNALVTLSSALPALVTSEGRGASKRFIEFFTITIRNAHTRRAYAQAAKEFLEWCESNGVTSIAAVQPLHVAAYAVNWRYCSAHGRRETPSHSDVFLGSCPDGCLRDRPHTTTACQLIHRIDGIGLCLHERFLLANQAGCWAIEAPAFKSSNGRMIKLQKDATNAFYGDHYFFLFFSCLGRKEFDPVDRTTRPRQSWHSCARIRGPFRG